MKFPLKFEENRKFDVVGFGTNSVDYLISVPKYPEYDSKIELNSYTQAAGGEIASTLSGLQRLGFSTAYIGRFGCDSAGDFGIEELRKEGVDVSNVQRIEEASSQIAFIIIDENTGERTVIWKRDKKLAYLEFEVPEGIVSKGRIFHFTPHDQKAAAKLAREARMANTLTSIDIDNTFEGLENLLPLVDILITSRDFSQKLFGCDDRRRSLTMLCERFGCSIVGMTLGVEGSLILSEGKFIETKAFPVPGGCRDTTGAGDSFRTGLLYGLLSGETIEDAARMANAVAALKCRALGARTSLPNQAEVEELISR